MIDVYFIEIESFPAHLKYLVCYCAIESAAI